MYPLFLITKLLYFKHMKQQFCYLKFLYTLGRTLNFLDIINQLFMF